MATKKKKAAKKKVRKYSAAMPISLVVKKNPRKVFTLEGGKKTWSDTYDVRLNGKLIGCVKANSATAAKRVAKELIRKMI